MMTTQMTLWGCGGHECDEDGEPYDGVAEAYRERAERAARAEAEWARHAAKRKDLGKAKKPTDITTAPDRRTPAQRHQAARPEHQNARADEAAETAQRRALAEQRARRDAAAADRRAAHQRNAQQPSP